ncbi:MAG: hypothetical protein C4321_08390, partial [Chloroflexota bacterium]
LPPFDWWRSSRVHFGTFDITEFPYWSFLFADLHPHLMGIPFFTGLVGIGATLVLAAARGQTGRAWALAAVAGLFVGLIRTVHTWDFPTAALLTACAILLAALVSPASPERRLWTALGQLTLAALLAIVPFAPYNARFETFDPGIVRAPATTPLHQLIVQFGIFLALTLGFIAVRCREELEKRSYQPCRNPILAIVAGPLEVASLLVFLAGLLAFAWPLGLATIAFAAVGEAFLLTLAWLELRNPERNLPRLLATLLLALALVIAAGVDVVTLKNDIVRMNTVFKFSLQAWHLFALGGAFAGWYLVRYLLAAQKTGPRLQRIAFRAALASLAAILVASSLFLVSGTRARQQARFGDTPLTLDGFAFFQHGTFTEPRSDTTTADDVTFRLDEDLPLITWLRQNVQGSPVIVEAVGPLYRWTGRISQYTGLPAVIGWDWHQIQQRTDYAHLVQQRRTEVQLFYTDPSTDAAERFLRKYRVRYVIVGTEERIHGTPAGLAKFTSMPALTEVFRSGENVIYAVDQERLFADILARDLANRSAAELPPEGLAEEARGIATRHGLAVDVIDERRAAELGMNLFLAVGRGSDNPPRFIVLRSGSPAARDGAGRLLALLGKGVCFDSGGISIKPADRMEEMKMDKAGAATVIAAAATISRLAPGLPFLVLAPAVENMPGPHSTRPGDVVRALNGKWVDITNTDAEGRLILGDALTYAERLGATHLVDVATLTGAVERMLGHLVTGGFGTPQIWYDTVAAAARRAGERLWQIPLVDDYRADMDSWYGDFTNAGAPEAGLVKSGLFLKEFATVPWVHLDIGGTAYFR